jgi:putative hydrolase of the HAD superfamily
VSDLEAIFFDIDDTLFSTSEFAKRARGASVDALIAAGLNMPREELLSELDEVVKEFTSNYEHHFDKLLLRLPRRATKGINVPLVVAAGVVAYHETKFRELAAYPDALALLKRLKDRTALMLGVITDGLAMKQAEKLVRLKVMPYLNPQAVYISDSVGVNKPNVKLYLRACADLNLKPANCMYVGDNPKNDVDPPNKLGMITVRMRRSGKYKDQESETKPRYEVKDCAELEDILVRDFRLPLREEAPAPEPAPQGTEAA